MGHTIYGPTALHEFPNLEMQFSGLNKGKRKRKRKEEYFDRGVSFNSAFPLAARVSPLSFSPPPPAPLGSPDARLGFCLLPAASVQRARPRARGRAVLRQPCRCARASGSRCGGTATRWRLTRRRGAGGARTIWWRSARTAARRACSRGAARGSRPSSLPLPPGSRRR